MPVITGKNTKREEFSKIYSDYYPLLFNIIFSKVNNRDDAGDICQEVFLICYNKFDEIENHRKWLFGTVRNVIYQFYAKRSDANVDIEKMFEDISMSFVNGFRDTRIIINEAIENVELDEQERLLFDYIAINNYSYTTAGKIMGFSKRQVGYKYLQIVQKILDYLKKRGIENIEDLL